MKYTGVLLLMLPLAGCFNDQKERLAQCELDAQRQHIRPDDEPRYESTCMMAHGYENSFADKRCQHASELDSFLEDFPFYMAARSFIARIPQQILFRVGL